MPTITAGFREYCEVKSSSHGRAVRLDTICSATSRESVSLHLPLTSVTVSVEMRVTCREVEQPARTTTAAISTVVHTRMISPFYTDIQIYVAQEYAANCIWLKDWARSRDLVHSMVTSKGPSW